MFQGLLPVAYIPSPEEEQLRHQFIELKLPFEPEFLPVHKQATAEAAHAAMRGEGVQAPQVAPSASLVTPPATAPDFKQALGAIVEAVRVGCGVDVRSAVQAGLLSAQAQTEPMSKAAVELDATSDLLPMKKPVDDAAQAAMREPGAVAAPTEPQETSNDLKTLAPPQPEPLLKPAVQPDDGAMIQATEAMAPRTPVVMTRETVPLVREQPAAAPAPAPVPVAAPAPVATPAPAPAPVAAPTPAAAPAPAAASTPALTPAQVDVLKGAWAAVGTDAYQVLKWMDEYGINAAQFAQAVGTTEQNVADALTLMGASHGYGSALTLSREELNADFEAQLQGALQANGGKIDLNAFVRDYMSRDTAASRQFARLHGAMQFSSQASTPDQFDEGALVVKGQAGMQTVTFGTGYTIRVGEGAALVRLTQWEPNQQVQQHMAIPKVSHADRQAILADYGKQNEKLLQVYGGNEALPDNDVTRSLKIKYGEAVATLMYRVDKAMERARNDYIGGVQGAMAAGSGRGWVERTKTVVDESGPHEVKTQEFDVRAFHAAITGGADPKSQVLKELFGELQEHNGEFTIRGQGGVQHFTVSYSESGQPSLQVGQLEAPEGTRKIDLANPPKLKDASAVTYIPGVGFVTDINNVIPPKKKKNKWKMALAIVATVAVVAFTAGTAAPAVCGAMGLTGASATVAGTIAAGAITGAMTAAASTITSGLILNGKVDGKALLKGMVAGAITGALFAPPPGADAASAGAGTGAGAGAGAGASTATASGLTNSLQNRMLVQGLISKAQGGKFISGAMSAAAADVGKFVDANVADALKTSALGSVAGNLGKVAGSLAKAGVSSGGHGGERFWGSVANDIADATVKPHVQAWIDEKFPQYKAQANGQRRPERSQPGATSGATAPSPAPQVDPLEQASPPADLYGNNDQWASDNQQALEDDQRAQQRAQEEARSHAQSSFRQSELEAQQRPLQLTPPDLDNWDLSGGTSVNGQVGTQTQMRAGDYAGSVERMVKAHLGPNATQREINRGVAQALEINGITNARTIQPNEIIRMPDASTQAPTWGLQVRDRDNAIGQQIQIQREAARADQNRGMSVVEMPSTGDSRSSADGTEPWSPVVPEDPGRSLRTPGWKDVSRSDVSPETARQNRANLESVRESMDARLANLERREYLGERGLGGEIARLNSERNSVAGRAVLADVQTRRVTDWSDWTRDEWGRANGDALMSFGGIGGISSGLRATPRSGLLGSPDRVETAQVGSSGASTTNFGRQIDRYGETTRFEGRPIADGGLPNVTSGLSTFTDTRGLSRYSSNGINYGGLQNPTGPYSSRNLNYMEVPDRPITNPVLDEPRIGWGEKGQGSGNKIDQVLDRPVLDSSGERIPVRPTQPNGPFATQEFPSAPSAHGFSNLVDNYAGNAKSFTLNSGAKLYQVEGSLNGVAGRFEWIVDPKMGGMTHRMFVRGGTVNGIPVKP